MEAAVSVASQDGAVLGEEPTRLVQDGLITETALPSVGEGIYVVSYNVLADDGHVTAGEFAFAVGDVGEITSKATDQADIAWLQGLTRWLILIGLLIGFGGLVSQIAIWGPLAAARGVEAPQLPLTGLLVLAAVGAAGALAALVLSAPQVGSAGWIEVLTSGPALRDTWQLGLLILGIQLARIPRLRAWSLVPLGIALMVVALNGHAATAPAWAAAANVVHVAAVGLWLGGLAQLVLVLWRAPSMPDRSWLSAGAWRYATYALITVGAVLLTGVVVAAAQLRSPSDLIDSLYGRMLMLKVVLVAIALGLALYARRRGLLGNGGIRRLTLRRASRAEILAVIGTVAIAALLGATSPPRAASASAFLLGPPPLDGPVLRYAGLAGSMAVQVAAAKDRLQVRALAPDGEGEQTARLTVSGETPDGTIDWQPRDCGPGCWTTAFDWPAGTTSMEIAVSSLKWGGGVIPIQLSWPPGPDRTDLLDRVVAAMRAAPQLTMVEQVTSGPGMSGGKQTFTFTGREFVAAELYAAGGATDVHEVAPRVGARAVTLFLPGSSIWFRLELGADDRIVSETIVSSGHLIERTFGYP